MAKTKRPPHAQEHKKQVCVLTYQECGAINVLKQEKAELLEALKDIARGKLQEPQSFESYAVNIAKRAITNAEGK